MLCSSCSRPVHPVLAIDLDGTLCDYHETFRIFVASYFGMDGVHRPSVPHMPWDGEGEFEDYLGINKAEYREAKLAYRQGGHKRWARLYPGARRILHDLHAHGAEIWIATSRPWQRLDNIDPDTKEFIARKGLHVDGLLYGDDKYHLMTEAVDRDRIIGVVDDLAFQIDRAKELGLPAFQRTNLHNKFATEQREPRGDLFSAYAWCLEQIGEWEKSHAA